MDKEGPEYLVEIVEFFHDCFPIFFCIEPFIDGVAQEICDRLKYWKNSRIIIYRSDNEEKYLFGQERASLYFQNLILESPKALP